MVKAALTILSFVLGAMFGSFGGVLADRLPGRENWISGRSKCNWCGHTIRFRDLVPIFSYLSLKGRCRDCGRQIPTRYPLIELICGGLWVLCALVFGLSPFTPTAWSVCTVVLIAAVIDLDTQEIPNGLSLFLLVIGLIWNFAAFFAGYGIWLQNLIGAGAASSVLFFLSLTSKGGIGGGDIKLMAACGLILGWQLSLLSLAAASIIGSAALLPRLAAGKVKKGDLVPFMPYLAAGTVAAMLAGQVLWPIF